MPQQLIHTSAAHLLDCEGGGYGTVARSENLPRILCDRLTALSGYREVACRELRGAQYAYRVLPARGTAYHVLTRVQTCGADYSGRACHIAHHLVLTAAEAEAMRRHPARPTPAGIMLAMEQRGLWRCCWNGEPSFLTGVPVFCADDMPDAAAQPTWKRMTGHKGNARAFKSVRFESAPIGCVCTLVTRAGEQKFPASFGAWTKGSIKIDTENYEGLGGYIGEHKTMASCGFDKAGAFRLKAYLTGTTGYLEFTVKDGRVSAAESEMIADLLKDL